MTMTLAEIAARLEITEVIHRYCRAVDRIDEELGRSVFHDDAAVEFPSYRGTGYGWIEKVCTDHRRLLGHVHQVAGIVIEVNGERAVSEARIDAVLRQQNGDQVFDHHIRGRYLDDWARRDGRWAIADRRCIIDLRNVVEVAAADASSLPHRDRTDESYRLFDHGRTVQRPADGVV